MPYGRGGGRGGRRGGGRGRGDGLRLTGLFESTKDNLHVGTLREQDVEALEKVCGKALDARKGVVFFLWENRDAREGEPPFSLSCAVAQDQQRGGGRRGRRIEPDDGADLDRDRDRDRGRRRRDRDDEPAGDRAGDRHAGEPDDPDADEVPF